MSATVFGSGIRRREDPRLMSGTGTFTDDIVLPNLAHAAILRSPYAHARITRIDTARAGAGAGVLAVYTAADTEGALKAIPCLWLVPGSDLKVGAYPAFAKDVVRYVGDCVAVVVAGADDVPEQYRKLIEQYYRSLSKAPEKAADKAPDRVPDKK